jgi:hypothetical protein
MELHFLSRAQAEPRLRPAQRLHAACCLAGLACFALEEARPELPLVHSLWHCLSATAVGSVNALMRDVEERHDAKLVGACAPLQLTARAA